MKISYKSIPLYHIINLHKLRFTVPCILLLLLSITFYSPAFSQQKNKEPHWWFGVAGGANFNFYNGTTSALNVDINASPAFHKGNGVGGYAAGVLQYHRPGALVGFMLQEGLDSRRATFKESGRKLVMKIGYFTIEPSLVIRPLKKPLYFYIGPRIGLLWHTEFTYKAPNAPEYPQKNVNYPAHIKNLDKITASIQTGIGYDIRGSAKSRFHNIIVSPFITYLPSLGQNLRTIENLKLNTIRTGIILKTGIMSQH